MRDEYPYYAHFPLPGKMSRPIWDDTDRCPRCGRSLRFHPTDRWPDIYCTRCGKGHRY